MEGKEAKKRRKKSMNNNDTHMTLIRCVYVLEMGCCWGGVLLWRGVVVEGSLLGYMISEAMENRCVKRSYATQN